jgi:hypothetical protein
MAGIRDGQSSMLTKLLRLDQRDMTVNMDSTSIDHSTSDQECQCGELPKMFQTILDLEDMSLEEESIKPSHLIECPTLSSLSTPNPIHSTSTVTEVVHTSN